MEKVRGEEDHCKRERKMGTKKNSIESARRKEKGRKGIIRKVKKK